MSWNFTFGPWMFEHRRNGSNKSELFSCCVGDDCVTVQHACIRIRSSFACVHTRLNPHTTHRAHDIFMYPTWPPWWDDFSYGAGVPIKCVSRAFTHRNIRVTYRMYLSKAIYLSGPHILPVEKRSRFEIFSEISIACWLENKKVIRWGIACGAIVNDLKRIFRKDIF